MIAVHEDVAHGGGGDQDIFLAVDIGKAGQAQTGIAGVIDRGEKLVASVGKAINDQVNTVLGSIF